MEARYKVRDYSGIANALSATALGKYWSGNKNIGDNKVMVKQRTYRKRTTKSKKSKRRGLIRRQIPRSIAPANKVIRCKFSDYQSITCTSGALSRIAIRANDITDPLEGFSLQQPLGYDQWKALYRTAYVIGVKVKFSVWNNSSTALMYGITMCDKNQGSTSLANYEYYKEVPHNVARLLSPDVDHGYLINKASTKKMLHLKNIKDNDGIRINLQSDTAPTETYYAHCWIQPVDQTTTLTAVQSVIDLEYIVLLTNPIIPARSTN